MIKTKHNVIDLFAGCGGLLDGFEQTSCFNTIAAVDWDKHSCLNLENRLRYKWGCENAESIVMHFDIQRTEELFNGWSNSDNYNANLGLDSLVNKAGNVDIIIGGPPCQAYSVAGRIRDAHGMRNDYRNYLFEAYIKVVSRYKPKLVVFENVQGICSAKPGGYPIINRVKEAFYQAGYHIIDDLNNKAVIDFSNFGVPQNRKRIIIIGVNRSVYGSKSHELLNDFYDEILPNFQVEQKTTVRDYIADLPEFYPTAADYTHNGKRYSHAPKGSDIANHAPRYHNKRDIEIFKELALDVLNGSKKYKTVDDIKRLYTAKTGLTSNIHKYYVLRWVEQSNTIPAHLHKDGLRHIHPDPVQARSITVREAARLQTFSDDFEFISSQSESYRMIGNAVPPLFAKSLALAIDSLLLRLKSYSS